MADAGKSPQRCGACGVEAYQGQEFTLEGFPLLGKKLRCEACLKKLHDRLYLTLAALVIALAFWGLATLFWQGQTLSQSLPLRLSLLLILQWLLIFPHELGHALSGRAAGFQNIRIVIGLGKPIVRFRSLGFHWLINLIPFGGLTLADDYPKSSRTKNLIFVAGGPAINLFAALAAWGVLAFASLSEAAYTLTRLFLLANLIVLLSSIFPARVSTLYGKMATDGLLLIEFWNCRKNPANSKSSRWVVVPSMLFKWLLGLAVLTGSIFIAVASFLLLNASLSVGPPPPTALALLAVLFLVATAGAWAAWRILRHPLPEWNFGTTPSGSLPQTDTVDSAADQTLHTGPGISPHDSCNQIHCAIMRGHLDQAREMLDQFLAGPSPVAEKIHQLDTIASMLIYSEPSKHLEFAEDLICAAIELAPGVVTLKGTLGGVLAELGRFDEAEPFLQECYRSSSALHDQAISAFYLATIAHAKGQPKRARTLADDAVHLYSADWLKQKHSKLIAAMNSSSR